VSEIDYEIWRLWHGTGDAELEAMATQQASFERRPTVSLLLPAGELDEIWLRDGVASLARQVYPEWELCVCQRGERARVEDLIPGDPSLAARVRIVSIPDDSDPSTGEALHAVLAAAAGEYVAFVGEGDELAPDALFRVVEVLQGTDADVVYTDEDTIDHLGRHSDPLLKPDWSPDLMLSSPYVGRLSVIRRQLLLADPGTPVSRPAEIREYDQLLRATERAWEIVHLPHVLYHRRAARPLPDGDRSRPSAEESDALIEVVESSLARRREAGRVRPVPGRASVRVLHERDWATSVSVIVQTSRRGQNLALLRYMVQRSGANEVIAASSERMRPNLDVKVVVDRSPARAANLAAAEASGEILVFIAATASLPRGGSGWLAELVSQAAREQVGAVSGRVVAGDGSVRHGGKAVDLSGLYELIENEEPEPDDHETLMLREMLNPGAATDELMAIDMSRFEAAGGFDEAHLPNRFYGLDLSLRLEEVGLRSVYTPYVAVVSRGPRPNPAPAEIAYMWERWHPQLARLHSERWPANDRRHDRRLSAIAELAGLVGSGR
jgi:hypothetical protein